MLVADFNNKLYYTTNKRVTLELIPKYSCPKYLIQLGTAITILYTYSPKHITSFANLNHTSFQPKI